MTIYCSFLEKNPDNIIYVNPDSDDIDLCQGVVFSTKFFNKDFVDNVKNEKELIGRNISDFYVSPSERERLIKKYDTKLKSNVQNEEVKFKKKNILI